MSLFSVIDNDKSNLVSKSEMNEFIERNLGQFQKTLKLTLQ